ncbi:phosphatase 2C-like domain-containing protein [Syncephalastrum racemosum]|uniref:Protein phosphatase n=1 Tax=Syncephalastrum racemosum TaxID=13706 RepID=A0A1X2H6H7_SYNRA|nr:phosphatase 2C-like domain-containing protein [Syncephalastrum racemosum]
MLLFRAIALHRSVSARSIRCTSAFYFHTSRSRFRSAAVVSHQEKSTGRANLNVIDFFDPALSTTPHHYTFQAGSSGYAKAGKKDLLSPQEDAIYSSIQVGDDAYFKRPEALGVADGVGGWRSHTGANPALYSRKLMHYAQLELERIKTNQRPAHVRHDESDPVLVLENAYHLTTLDAQNEGIVGSTTACIVILCEDELRIANLGDCGVSVIRRDDYVFRSEEQQHSFNFPYQLGTASFDSPSDAQQFTIKVEEGDIVILASDGLFDNLYDDEILEEVQQCIQENKDRVTGDESSSADESGSDPSTAVPQVISDALAHRAKCVSEDPTNPSSPFQVRAMHEGLYYQGGKADDISVLVAIVNRVERPPEYTPPPLP